MACWEGGGERFPDSEAPNILNLTFEAFPPPPENCLICIYVGDGGCGSAGTRKSNPQHIIKWMVGPNEERKGDLTVIWLVRFCTVIITCVPQPLFVAYRDHGDRCK